MKRFVSAVSLVVSDYDVAIEFYVGRLGFALIEDTQLTENKRWVLVAPDRNCETKLLLAKADTPAQEEIVGKQTGGRVFLFLNTDNFERDFNRFTEAGVEFVREPVSEVYGRVAVFHDPFGNLWDLIEPAT